MRFLMPFFQSIIVKTPGKRLSTRKLIWRMCVTLFAYLIAAIGAGLVLHATIIWTQSGSFALDLDLIILTSLIAANVLFLPTALPLLLAEYFGWRSVYFYLALTALIVSLFPFMTKAFPFLALQGEWASFVPLWGWGLSILASASLYWLFAGRHAGDLMIEDVLA